MRKAIFKISIFLITLLILFNIFTFAYAAPFNPQEFKEATTPDMGSGIAAFGGQIIYIIQYVGYTVAVITLLGIGIKYMMSAPNEKADLKARLVPYVIGCLLLFGGVSIMSLIYDIVKNAN